MAIDARIRELGNRHQNLDLAIQQEMARPTSDSLRVHEMKRQKLKIKEEIAQLQSRSQRV